MKSHFKIAVVEDHHDLRELLLDLLHTEQLDAVGFACADDLDDHLISNNIDLILLDITLPGEDGYSIASRLKQAHPNLYIIMVSAHDGINARVQGYTSGADIYLTKPVAPEELLAAVHSIGRRLGHDRIGSSQLRLNTTRLELLGELGRINLSQPEVLLLKALAEAPENGLSYWRCLELLQLELDDKGKNLLEVRIHRLKKKLHQVGAPVPAIKSVRKEAYQLCIRVCIEP
ncbi:MAG: response regulator transcription factor [Gammaproteobacteria bacterium]|nr:response regulator transcription factor [Gammaproteobacteria bacterium]